LNLFPAEMDPTPAGEGAAVERPMVEARTTRRASLLESILDERGVGGRKVGCGLETREGVSSRIEEGKREREREREEGGG